MRGGSSQESASVASQAPTSALSPQRPAPLSPAHFEAKLRGGVADGLVAFTNGTLDLERVIRLYASGFERELSSAHTLCYVGVGWGDDEASQLAEALQWAPPARDGGAHAALGAQLRHIHLGQNEIGDRGFRVLAEVLPQLRALRSLRLDGNCASDEGKACVRAACARLPACSHVILDAAGAEAMRAPVSGQIFVLHGPVPRAAEWQPWLFVYKLTREPHEMSPLGTSNQSQQQAELPGTAGAGSPWSDEEPMPAGLADLVVYFDGGPAGQRLLLRNTRVDVAHELSKARARWGDENALWVEDTNPSDAMLPSDVDA